MVGREIQTDGKVVQPEGFTCPRSPYQLTPRTKNIHLAVSDHIPFISSTCSCPVGSGHCCSEVVLEKLGQRQPEDVAILETGPQLRPVGREGKHIDSADARSQAEGFSPFLASIRSDQAIRAADQVADAFGCESRGNHWSSQTAFGHLRPRLAGVGGP